MRTDLLRRAPGGPGREVLQVRVDSAPEVAFCPHRHPGEEIACALEGLPEYRFEGRAPAAPNAGEALFIPPGTIHAARNVGDDNAAGLVKYFVQKGEPLITLVR